MDENQTTVGKYLATRLEQIGLKHYFAVPGDYNLVLLDELLTHPKLQMINCCNELNAGYAADGYARAHGLSALVVTYSVGGLSAINAIAGAFAEDLPVIIISGSPGPDSEIQNKHLHHTIGEINYRYVRDIFSYVTAHSVTINHVVDAPFLIDQAINTALRTRKPVYIDIPCNISSLQISAPLPLSFDTLAVSDDLSLKAAVSHATSLLNSAVKPVLVAGVKLRPWNALKAFQKLIAAAQYAVAAMPNAKGMISEKDPRFIGIYWGPVSTPGCAEIIEGSDLYLFAGPVFTDYTTTGYSALIKPEKLIHVAPDHVKICGHTYNNIMIADFLSALSQKVKPNHTSLNTYKRIHGVAPPPAAPTDHNVPLTARRLFVHIEEMLDSKSTVIAETGDSWFNGNHLKLPKDCHYEVQMQYGSIGWSVGAVLGYAIAKKDERRVIGLIGDGSFQMTAQEISTIIRYKLNPIIFLINNHGYTIEVEIHDGPYNNIKNWQYSELVQVFNAEDGKGWSCKVSTEKELISAIKTAKTNKGLSFIEVILDRNDCNKNLLQWGTRVANYNSKPPITFPS